MNLGDNLSKNIGMWSFDKDVANNFDEHVQKSIINYRSGHELICRLSDFFCKNDSVCYDLGISTGTLLKKLVNYQSANNIKWYGIDISSEMIEKASENLRDFSNVILLNEDIVNVDFEKADFIISYYTMQFIHPKNRQKIIEKIYNSLNEGGAFVWFEKVLCEFPKFQDIFNSLYIEFKLDNDFTSEEIINKTRSLYGVLNSYTTKDNFEMLISAGFKSNTVIMKNLCFEGYLCVK